jgi:serine/threonine protein kinase
MQLKTGDTIDEFRILEVIGEGGFSIVYKAEDTRLRREVAIKQMLPEAFSAAGTREWFIREAQLAASLNHPNVVSIFALRERHKAVFLIMEYLPGGDLHTFVEKRGPLTRSGLLRVATDVCRALEVLHSNGIIHRDIKPENILIGREGQFKLADFGLAHDRLARHPNDLNNSSGPQPGTLLYMSPEQALGQQITVRSDVYSLAIVLYEAITGHYYLNYDMQQDDDVLQEKVISEDPLPMNVPQPGYLGSVQVPIMRALSKDPAARPASAGEFLTEIRNAVARSKHATLSQVHRQFNPQVPQAEPDLLEQLYAIRTLRDADDKPQNALKQLEALWNEYRGVPEVAAEWGETLVALGRNEEGRLYLEQATRLRPLLPFAQLALADLYREEDDSAAEANEALVRAIQADPDLVYAVLYEEIIESLEDSTAYESYVTAFRRAADEHPTAPVLHNLGQVLALDPLHHDASRTAFAAAMTENPDYGPPYVGLASLFVEMQRLPDAVSLLEQATARSFPEIAPEDWHKSQTVYQRSHAHVALAVTYAQLGQFEESADAARMVLELNPADLQQDAPELLDLYAEAAENWLREGEQLQAINLLNRIMPIAAHWGHIRSFAALATAQQQANTLPQPRRRQWDDALGWLKVGLSGLRRTAATTERPRFGTQTPNE